MANDVNETTETQRKLERFRTLPTGWHYGEGGPIPGEIIDLAIRTEAMLLAAGYPETDCFPGSDGEVHVTGYRVQEKMMVTIEISGENYEPHT